MRCKQGERVKTRKGKGEEAEEGRGAGRVPWREDERGDTANRG